MKFCIPTLKQKKNERRNESTSLITQFFISENPDRHKEIVFCLNQHIQNKYIDHIYLLNERIYTIEELGILNTEKITQVIIGRRMTFEDAIEKASYLNGDIIVSNMDIFFDETISNIKYIDPKEKTIFCQLRYEYTGDIETSKIYNQKNVASQDSWIFHTDHTALLMKYKKAFNFELGKLGCDNKIAYLFKILNYNVSNDPSFIRTFHYHTSGIRTYSTQDIIQPPHCLVAPYNQDCYFDRLTFDDNDKLFDYISKKINANENFIIPRIAGEENRFAVDDLIRYDVMKRNAGILITNDHSRKLYQSLYLKSFENCEIYTGWEKDGAVYKYIGPGQEFIRGMCRNKPMLWAFSLDIFHYIHHPKLWTLALKKKKNFNHFQFYRIN